MSTRDIEVLRKLAETKKLLKDRSTKDKVVKDYGQTTLKEAYKPLLEGQQQQTKSIVEKQDSQIDQQRTINYQRRTENQQQQNKFYELINEVKQQPLIIPLIKSLNSHPNVIKVIYGETDGSDLDDKEQHILKQLEKSR